MNDGSHKHKLELANSNFISFLLAELLQSLKTLFIVTQVQRCDKYGERCVKLVTIAHYITFTF